MSKDSEIKVEVFPAFKAPEYVKEVVDKQAFLRAGWNMDDPTSGKTVMTEDGREVYNPMPIDPPLGYVPGPTIMEMIDQQVRRHMAQLNGDDVIDDGEEADDFDMPDELDPVSGYEVFLMQDEAPGASMSGSTPHHGTDAMPLPRDQPGVLDEVPAPKETPAKEAGAPIVPADKPAGNGVPISERAIAARKSQPPLA